jgi:dienelactone hydrolase
MWAALVLAAGVGVSLIYFWIWRDTEAWLPETTGPWGAGRTILTVVDGTRPDPFGSGVRRLSVVLWYPTEPQKDVVAPYAPGQWMDALDRANAVNALVYRSVSRVYSRALTTLPSGGKHPLLLFEPGYGKTALEYSALLEGLASRGFVIAAITPTYSVRATVIDGKIVEQTSRGTVDEDAAPDKLEAGLRHNLLPVWMADFDSVRTFLLGSAKFGAAIDLSKVALVGHSLGGAAAVEHCVHVPWCSAAVDIDGRTFLETESTVPRLLIGVSKERAFLSHLQSIRYQQAATAPHEAATDIAWQFNPVVARLTGHAVDRPAQTINTIATTAADFLQSAWHDR